MAGCGRFLDLKQIPKDEWERIMLEINGGGVRMNKRAMGKTMAGDMGRRRGMVVLNE